MPLPLTPETPRPSELPYKVLVLDDDDVFGLPIGAAFHQFQVRVLGLTSEYWLGDGVGLLLDKLELPQNTTLLEHVMAVFADRFFNDRTLYRRVQTFLKYFVTINPHALIVEYTAGISTGRFYDQAHVQANDSLSLIRQLETIKNPQLPAYLDELAFLLGRGSQAAQMLDVLTRRPITQEVFHRLTAEKLAVPANRQVANRLAQRLEMSFADLQQRLLQRLDSTKSQDQKLWHTFWMLVYLVGELGLELDDERVGLKWQLFQEALK